MKGKWAIKIITPILALTLITACGAGNNDMGPTNDDAPLDQPNNNNDNRDMNDNNLNRNDNMDENMDDLNDSETNDNTNQENR